MNKNNDKKVINCKFSQFFLEFVALLLVWNDVVPKKRRAMDAEIRA